MSWWDEKAADLQRQVKARWRIARRPASAPIFFAARPDDTIACGGSRLRPARAIINGLVEPILRCWACFELMAYVALRRHVMAEQVRAAKQQTPRPCELPTMFPFQ